MGVLEICAVVLALIYVILAIFQRRLCWIAAIASASLYIVIFWQVQLYLEAALQVFYIAMAVYGWFAWQQKDDESQTPIRKWSPKQHAMACSTLVFLSVLIGSAMARWTDAASPLSTPPLPCLPCLPLDGGAQATGELAVLDCDRYRIDRLVSVTGSLADSSAVCGIRPAGSLGLSDLARTMATADVLRRCLDRWQDWQLANHSMAPGTGGSDGAKGHSVYDIPVHPNSSAGSDINLPA